jgi:hypothetical protein
MEVTLERLKALRESIENDLIDLRLKIEAGLSGKTFSETNGVHDLCDRRDTLSALRVAIMATEYELSS